MDELVKSLRICADGENCDQCAKWDIKQNGGRNACEYAICTEAADAIEELQSKHFMMKKTAEWLAEKVPHWIPVNERLPEDDTDVLCWYEYYHWSAQKVLPEYGIGHCWNGRLGGEVSSGRECKVLAWMPLPQPPKEE